jgi:hypothetical protein
MAGEARALPFRQRLGLDRRIRAIGHHVVGAVLFDHPRRAGLRVRGHRGLPVGLLRRARPGPADGLQGDEIGVWVIAAILPVPAPCQPSNDSPAPLPCIAAIPVGWNPHAF